MWSSIVVAALAVDGVAWRQSSKKVATSTVATVWTRVACWRACAAGVWLDVLCVHVWYLFWISIDDWRIGTHSEPEY